MPKFNIDGSVVPDVPVVEASEEVVEVKTGVDVAEGESQTAYMTIDQFNEFKVVQEGQFNDLKALLKGGDQRDFLKDQQKANNEKEKQPPRGMTSDEMADFLDKRDAKKELSKIKKSITDDEKELFKGLGMSLDNMGKDTLDAVLKVARKKGGIKKQNQTSVDTSVQSTASAQDRIKKMAKKASGAR